MRNWSLGNFITVQISRFTYRNLDGLAYTLLREPAQDKRPMTDRNSMQRVAPLHLRTPMKNTKGLAPQHPAQEQILSCARCKGTEVLLKPEVINLEARTWLRPVNTVLKLLFSELISQEISNALCYSRNLSGTNRGVVQSKFSCSSQIMICTENRS